MSNNNVKVVQFHWYPILLVRVKCFFGREILVILYSTHSTKKNQIYSIVIRAGSDIQIF